MPLRMRTQSAVRLAVESLGGGTGVRDGRGERGRRPREVMMSENVRNVFVNGNQVGCSYKEFLACNPKEYDVYDDRRAFCSHEMQKLETELWNHAMVGVGHAVYTDRFHELARLVPHLVTPKSKMIESLLHLADSQPMLKSSYKVEDGVIISIPPLVGGVADVVVEIKGT
nr:reverse transcriptase domain-containing protein [Tanacetum cinerariifolium]